MESVNNINTKAIDRLIRVSGSIYNRYLLLSRLETRNCFLKPKYKSVIEEIKLAEDIEFSLYKEIGFENIEQIMEYIGEGLEDVDFNDDFYAIITNQDLLTTIRRNLNKYSFNALVRQSIFENPECNPFFNKDEYPNPFSKIIFGKALEKDTINRFVYYIEKECEKEENKDIKNRLLEAKYNVLFINPSMFDNIEDALLNTERLIITAPKIARRYDIRDEIITSTSNDYGRARFFKVFKELKLINDKKYEDQDIRVKSILSLCFMKTVLVGYSIEDIKKLERLEIEDQNSKYHKTLYSDNTITDTKILECFEEVKEDRKKIKIKD